MIGSLMFDGVSPLPASTRIDFPFLSPAGRLPAGREFCRLTAWLSGRQVEERAVIVQLEFAREDVAEQLEEVRLLTRSAGAEVCAVVHGRRHSPDAATYAGKGKVEEDRGRGGRARGRSRDLQSRA
jgi:hypothetical protein